MDFLQVICLLAGALAGIATAVGTYILEVVRDEETNGRVPCQIGLLGLLVGWVVAFGSYDLGWNVWWQPVLCPLTTIVVLGLFFSLSWCVGYVAVNGFRFVMRHSRRLALDLRERIHDYRFHRELDVQD
jgi:hypothetical protein